MSIDIGFTHIALSAIDIDESIAFYSKYANMSVIHERIDAETSVRVIWLSDKTRPFVIVLLQNKNPETILNPLSHLGVGCASKQEIDRLCDLARFEGILVREPQDSGYPIGYWALLQDPTGHTLELSYGQEVGLTVSQNDSSSGGMSLQSISLSGISASTFSSSFLSSIKDGIACRLTRIKGLRHICLSI